MQNYIPKPINTSNVILSEALESLIERLAENTHEVWSRQRIQDGWNYGVERNDQRKHHPCLIPYGQLSEEEKVYDRQTASEVLKAIVQLGYEIRPKSENAPREELA